MAVTSPVLGIRPVLVMHALCAAWTAGYGCLALVEPGPMRSAGLGLALTGLLVWGAVSRATLVPRSRRPVEPGPDGAVVIETPTGIIACLLGAWALLLVSVGLWVHVAVTDFGAVQSPGALLVMVGAALGSLPDLARLLLGRLYRWRVVADDSGISYRGYHSSWTLAWSDVTGVRSRPRPAGVSVAPRDGGPALFLSALAYPTHPDAIAQALRTRRPRRARP